MNIAIIGTGYVGLVTGACFADVGTNVVCVDTNVKKIENLKQGIIPIYEPGLEDVVARNIATNRLTFSTNLREVIDNVDVIFIAVGTPKSLKSDEADMSQIYQAAKDIAENMQSYKVIVNKSTVPLGTAQKVTDIIASINPTAEFDVVSNPEFLREGSALADFMKPDRIVVGANSDRARQTMSSLYKYFKDNGATIVMTDTKTSEIIKYAANSFLALKIGFINEVAQLCDACGANVQDVSLGIGMDNRIGKAFLNAGPGFGGSCFPKDIKAFAETARKHNVPVNIVETVIESNQNIQKKLADKIITNCGGNIEGKTICVLGLAFKANTDDIRQSPAISIIKHLLPYNPIIKAYDPIAMDNTKSELPELNYCSDIYDAAKDSDALVILTEWKEFCDLDFNLLAETMNKPMVIDLRNLYDTKEMQKQPVDYISIGRPSCISSVKDNDVVNFQDLYDTEEKELKKVNE